MAETKEAVDTQKVYTYDLAKTSHPLISEDELPVDQTLQANQTTVEPKNGSRYWNGTIWVDQLVIAYEFDPTKDNLYTGVAFIPQGAVLTPNQTFVKPEDGLYQPMRFNGTIWVGTPKEEWDKAHPAPVVKPNAGQIAQANTIKEVAQLKIEHSDQQTLNAQLMKENAELKVKNETQDKLNANIMKQLANLKIQVAALSQPTTQPQA